MEKLLELLNEHFKEKYKNAKRILIYFERYDDVNHWFNMNNEDRVYNWFVAEEMIFGKRYGFIKWLVENDKINFDMLKPLTWVTEIMLATNYPNWIEAKRRYRLYEQLTMLLSIQEDPIWFLISILK